MESVCFALKWCCVHWGQKMHPFSIVHWQTLENSLWIVEMKEINHFEVMIMCMEEKVGLFVLAVRVARPRLCIITKQLGKTTAEASQRSSTKKNGLILFSIHLESIINHILTRGYIKQIFLLVFLSWLCLWQFVLFCLCFVRLQRTRRTPTEFKQSPCSCRGRGRGRSRGRGRGGGRPPELAGDSWYLCCRGVIGTSQRPGEG